MASKRGARSIADELASGANLQGSLLGHLVEQNPDLKKGARTKRVRNADQELLYNDMIRTPRDFFGNHSRKSSGTNIRLGEKTEARVAPLIEDSRLSLTHLIEFALHRLLEDLGE